MENTRKKILENKIELDDEIIEEIIELPAESEGMNELPSYTDKNYRELSAVEKEDLINSLMNCKKHNAATNFESFLEFCNVLSNFSMIWFVDKIFTFSFKYEFHFGLPSLS